MAPIGQDITLPIGNTPLIRLNRIIPRDGDTQLARTEGRNLA